MPGGKKPKNKGGAAIGGVAKAKPAGGGPIVHSNASAPDAAHKREATEDTLFEEQMSLGAWVDPSKRTDHVYRIPLASKVEVKADLSGLGLPEDCMTGNGGSTTFTFKCELNRQTKRVAVDHHKKLAELRNLRISAADYDTPLKDELTEALAAVDFALNEAVVAFEAVDPRKRKLIAYDYPDDATDVAARDNAVDSFKAAVKAARIRSPIAALFLRLAPAADVVILVATELVKTKNMPAEEFRALAGEARVHHDAPLR